MRQRSVLLAAPAAYFVCLTTAHAGTITAEGTNCIALTDYSEMGVVQGMAEFDEGPTSGFVPLTTYSAMGLTFQTGSFAAILAGVTEPGNASNPSYNSSVTQFPQVILGNGIQNGNVSWHAGVALFDVTVTKFGLTAGTNGTQYINAWDETGTLIGQVKWVPGGTSSFVGIDCGNIPIKMISYGNDDMWNGGSYSIGGSTIMSDTWVWSGDTNCGNNVLDAGEECDDGNADYTDACTIGCKNASCGDKFVWAGMEACDDGNADNTDDCIDTCEAPTCGDGYIWDGMEDCDDGNADNTDGCLDTCLDPFCGDGHVWVGMEDCDDGNMDETDSCKNDCTFAGCGDGFVQEDEECDDGNQIATDGCTDVCLLPICGDGIVREFQEQCDDGNMVNTDSCVDCFNAFCGDGNVWEGTEDCDDGNKDESDMCLNDCTINPDWEGGSTGGDTDSGTTSDSGSGSGGSTTGDGSTSGDATTGETTGPATTGLTTFGSSDPAPSCSCTSDGTAPRGLAFLGLLLTGLARRRRAA